MRGLYLVLLGVAASMPAVAQPFIFPLQQKDGEQAPPPSAPPVAPPQAGPSQPAPGLAGPAYQQQPGPGQQEEARDPAPLNSQSQ